MNDRTGMPAFVVKPMETDAEKDGKAFVHYTAWTETYTGLMPEEYLSGRSLDRQRQRTYEHPENTLVAVADGRVVGFACYRPAARDFVSVKPAAEIGALYVLEAYQRRGIGSALMRACLSRMPPLPTALFVLRGNEKAIRFYEKNGFVFTGARLEQPVTGGTLVELEMVRAADRPKKPVSGTGNRLAKPGGDVYNNSLYPEKPGKEETEMSDKTMYRTHNCGELRAENAGETVTLAGWMENVREVGSNFAFIVLRDFYGTTQIVVENAEMMKTFKAVNKESTIAVTGTVRLRESPNAKLPTGEVEIVPEKVTMLGRCRYNELPFEINRSREADETARLRYRYLDLRNPAVKNNIILRSNVVAALRAAMTAHGFLEITTPILTASSPEGARDYLVPARKHPGKFYALPQAPQQFKQLLMTSGFDKYFQIAPCFRDEDARGDRSPGEFYQLDMEMAFASQEDVFAVLEDVLPPIFAKYGTYNVASDAPFRRIAYNDAMETYGTDKPDLRIDLTVRDITELSQGLGFEPFEGRTVKAVAVTGCTLTRKQIDKLCADVEVQAGRKPYWLRVDEHGAMAGGVTKFFSPKEADLREALSLEDNTLVLIAAGKKSEAQKTAGVMLKMAGAMVPGHMDAERYEFCWIVDFPMYEIGEESGELEFCHNPFSMPNGGLEILLGAERGEVDPLDIYAYQYDLVCNGVELSSGAVRNHDPEIMVKAFEMVRLGEDDVKAKFPAMYNAFCYGAPPHAGIAPGVDRMVMLLAGESSIREIIPFPMNKNAQDVMMGAPSAVEQKQLDELHIALVGETED